MNGKMLKIVGAVAGVLALCLVGGYALGNRAQTRTFACVDAVTPDARVDLVGPSGEIVADNIPVVAFKQAQEQLGSDRAGDVMVRLAAKDAKRIAEAAKAGPVHALSHALSTLLLGTHTN